MRTASYAVMFTDIKGFTERTSRQTRAENARLLRLHDALLLPVIEGYGGRRVKTIGDAYLVVFDSATRALACGAALQDRLSLYNRRVADPADRIEVRVAINAGEVRVERDDVYGEAVNIAARVEEQAEAGEVCFTEAVYLLADRSWIEVDDLGPHSLRGIPEPVRLYRLRRIPDAVLPYGGAALGTLKLPEPDPAELARRPWQLRRALRWLGLGLLLPALFLGGWTVARLGQPDAFERIEAIVLAGEVAEAERQLGLLGPEALEPAERAFLEGLVAERRSQHPRAIQRWTAAALQDASLGRGRVAPRLEALLAHEACDVRAAAARALGEIGARRSVGALRALSEREPEEKGFLARLKLGGCNAGDAARSALQKLEK